MIIQIKRVLDDYFWSEADEADAREAYLNIVETVLTKAILEVLKEIRPSQGNDFVGYRMDIEHSNRAFLKVVGILKEMKEDLEDEKN